MPSGVWLGSATCIGVRWLKKGKRSWGKKKTKQFQHEKLSSVLLGMAAPKPMS